MTTTSAASLPPRGYSSVPARPFCAEPRGQGDDQRRRAGPPRRPVFGLAGIDVAIERVHGRLDRSEELSGVR